MCFINHLNNIISCHSTVINIVRIFVNSVSAIVRVLKDTHTHTGTERQKDRETLHKHIYDAEISFADVGNIETLDCPHVIRVFGY